MIGFDHYRIGGRRSEEPSGAGAVWRRWTRAPVPVAPRAGSGVRRFPADRAGRGDPSRAESMPVSPDRADQPRGVPGQRDAPERAAAAALFVSPRLCRTHTAVCASGRGIGGDRLSPGRGGRGGAGRPGRGRPSDPAAAQSQAPCPSVEPALDQVCCWA